MNRSSALTLVALNLAVVSLATAGPSSTFFATPRSAKSPAPAPATPVAPAAATAVAAPTPAIFLVWRGAPHSATAGLTYVDATGRELSKSRELALEKATANAIAAAQREHSAKTAITQ